MQSFMRRNNSPSCRNLEQYRLFCEICHVSKLAYSRRVSCKEQAICPSVKHGHSSGIGYGDLSRAGKENNISLTKSQRCWLRDQGTPTGVQVHCEHHHWFQLELCNKIRVTYCLAVSSSSLEHQVEWRS